MSVGPTRSSARLALAVRQFQREHPDAKLANSDPIAIIGMGCRFPGDVKSPRDYWRLLRDGVDAISKAPPDRWNDSYYDPDPQAPGKMNSCWGGFVSGVDQFDPLLFGISPREAASIDPQQRLLLEVAWETLWDSGHAPDSLAGSRTGVFVGMVNSDYERLLFAETHAIGPHSCSGGYRSVASGRISFLLDLRGPSISLDTACSSSLSSVHWACQSLRMGECDLALAGGVTLHLLPEHYVGLAKLGMLSPHGRSRTFDASADGFVPGEGCGMIALKRLADALADGDAVYAVIRGTALNQDGRTNVLTAPNGLAQQAVIRAALDNAQVRASDIGFVETHGTGTALGDPIEVEALAEVLGSPSAQAPRCVLGAVKTNLGHLEAAAGIAGLMKAALALKHEEIPPNLHFETLNPNISLAGTRFHLPLSRTPWKCAETPRFAGISSFGFSGTNAHVILEEAPRVPPRPSVPELANRPYILPVSARTPEALRDYAAAYRLFLEQCAKDAPLYDICHTTACRRSHYEERVAITGANAEELIGALGVVVKDKIGRSGGRAGDVVFVCSGQGSQWARMGMSLYANEPVFRAAIEECDEVIRPHANWSLTEQLAMPEGESKLAETEYAQPAIFAIEVALARLWLSWGIEPACLIGHSAGEIAAAHIAGVLTLQEAVRLIVCRGRLMQAATGFGRMASVHLPMATVLEDLAPFGDRVSVAAINSPESIVVSGETRLVEELTRTWQVRGADYRLLPVNYAFHSAQMKPYSEDLVRELGVVQTHAEQIPIVSTVLGRIARGREFDAKYWSANVLNTVLFGPAVGAAIDRGAGIFLEVGPHPVLLGPIAESLGAKIRESTAESLLPSIRRDRDERRTMFSSLARLYSAGCTVAWDQVYPKTAPAVDVPFYPYQRKRHWLEPKRTPTTLRRQGLSGTRLESPALKGDAFEILLDLAAFPHLADHRINGRTLLPLTAMLEITQSALRDSAASNRTLSQVTVLEPLEIPADGCTVQVLLDDGAFSICSRQGEQWTIHATGRTLPARKPGSAQPPPDGDWSPADAHYAHMQGLGLDFGPSFRTIESLRAAPGEAWARVCLKETERREAAQYLFHPALLDGCLQAAIAGAPDRLEGALVPFSLDRFEIFDTAGTEVLAHVSVETAGVGDLLANIDIRDSAGRPVARMDGLRMRSPGLAASRQFALEWRPIGRAEHRQPAVGQFMIVSDDPEAGAALAEVLRGRGAEVRIVDASGPLQITPQTTAIVRMGEPTLADTLSLMQEVVLRPHSENIQLCIVTRGAVAAVAGDACPGLWQAPVWGLARTLAMEHPDRRCMLLDLDPGYSDWGALASEIISGRDEEVAFRAGVRLMPKLVRSPAAPNEPLRWMLPDRGSIDHLTLAPMERRAPGPGEVEIQVEASALNFRDVLNVLGMYPGDAGHPGIDFCGRVARVGEGVKLQPGARVMGLAWGALASYVTTPAALVVPVPAGWSAENGAAAANAFLTAWHCLVRVGKLRRGETVLIHSGAGGVGLAAIQIALGSGARVFATAGSDQKRDYLRSLGVEQVFSSRTLNFAREILACAGKGVDLILNSLAGDFIAAGFDALASGGRFIEIGKNGIWTQEQVSALGKPAHYFIVDLAEMISSQPAQIQTDLAALRREFESGALAPLPVRVFDFAEAPSAFRYMAQARHIGKVVLRHAVPLRISGEATYLITGGLGAIGLEIAQWLVSEGARHLMLVGRGAPSDAAAIEIRKMLDASARIEVRTADVARREELEAVLCEIRQSMPPLRGIVHAAGVLDDGVILQQTAERIRQVLAPKATGAWNLHELTADVPLDFFVLCSSIASLTGSPGQAGYTAANAFLDALAQFRRARGMAGLAVNLGAWPGAGMAARVNREGRRLSLSGVKPMPAEEYLENLKASLNSGRSQVAIADVDWKQIKPPRQILSELACAETRAAAEIDDFAERLNATPVENRRKLLTSYLRDTARRILGLSPTYSVDERLPLTQIGLDSLMATEFKNQLAATLHLSLNATLLFDHPTIASLADFLEKPEVTPVPETSDALFKSLADVSEEEAENLLKMELERS